MSSARIAAVAVLAAGCALLQRGAADEKPQLVSIAERAPGVQIDMRYAAANNFVGARIDGYEAPVCLLTEPAARALAAVERDLEDRGLGLRVYDCYRPQRAVDRFARWAEDLADQKTKPDYYPRVEKSELFEKGYIALHSGHSRGSTVDLTLVARGADGSVREVDMGSPFDLFDPRSNTESPEIELEARRNRLRLRSAMELRGFRNLPLEWWHYTLAPEPYPDRSFDVPVK